MIWAIAEREVRDKFTNRYFLATSVLLASLMAISAYVGASRYNQLVVERDRAERAHWEELAGRNSTYFDVANSVAQFHRRPFPLQILVKGASRETEETHFRLFLIRDIPTAVSAYIVNSFSSYFQQVDLAFIIGALFSLFGFLFSYDSVNAENEQGTLRLVLSNSLSRSQIILGKMLGGSLGLFIPLTLGWLLAALILLLKTDLGAGNAPALLIIYLISALYLLTCYELGILVSVMIDSATTALLALLLLWASLFIVYPSLAASYASAKHPVLRTERHEQADLLVNEATQKWQAELSEIVKLYRRTDLVMYRREINRIDKDMMSVSRRYVETTTTLPLRAQADLFRRLCYFSPAAAFYQSAFAAAGSDAESEARIVTSLLDYIQNVYAPYMFEMQVQEVIEANGQFPKPRRLDFSGLPRFQPSPEPFAARLERALPAASALAFYCLIFFIASYVAFIKISVQ